MCIAACQGDGTNFSIPQSRKEVAAVYLFGSVALGTQGPLSDYDVGVLLSPRSSEGSSLGLRLRLMDAFSKRFHPSSVDVVLLNQAFDSFNYSVIKSGRLVYERNRAARVSFEARTLSRYLDSEPFERVRMACIKRYFGKRR
jgi:hypothetical protein